MNLSRPASCRFSTAAVAVLFNLTILSQSPIFAQDTTGASDGATYAAAPEASTPEECESPVSFSLDAAVATKYLWRGLVLTDGAVFQPAGTVSYTDEALGTFSANIWANMDIADANDSDWEINEVDYTVSYSNSVDIFNLEVGHIYYDFPNTDFPGTAEVYAGVGLDTILAPTLKAFYDYDEAEGWYLLASISHSIDLGNCLSLDLGANLGYMDGDMGDFYYGGAGSGFSNVDVIAGLSYALNDNTSLSLAVQGTSVLDSQMRDNVDEADNVIGIAAVGFTF